MSIKGTLLDEPRLKEAFRDFLESRRHTQVKALIGAEDTGDLRVKQGALRELDTLIEVFK